ncbi:MAG: ribosome-binding factor A [Candidatus Niyogibacteria bacterium]|nr:ribosome-binding factor A [Candidatus Niyogibacteria bacterium]
MNKRQEKANSAIQKLAAGFIQRNIDIAGVMTTVTRVETSPGFGEAKIFFSVWPEEKEEEVLKALKNNLGDFYEYAKKNLKIKYMPSFKFEVDTGEKTRFKIESILKKQR